MRHSIKFRLVFFTALSSVLISLVGCNTVQPYSVSNTSTSTSISAERISAILNSADRSSADLTNDLRRKPKDLLAFIAPRPGMLALDLSAGGGYTTELLARAIGSTGKVYGQSQARDPARAAPAAPEGNSHPGIAGAASAPAAVPRTSADALAERSKKLIALGVDAATIVAVVRRFEDPVPAEVGNAQLDLVTLMFNYHDLGHMGANRAQMNAAVFRALKPGAAYVIADHAGRAGTGISESGTLHRIEEDFLIQEVEAAGFKLIARGDFLKNPNDPRDRNTPNPPMPKDEFVLKFVKP